MHPHTSGYIIRVRWSEGNPNITLQNVSTRETATLTSWAALLEALQPPAGTGGAEGTRG